MGIEKLDVLKKCQEILIPKENHIRDDSDMKLRKHQRGLRCSKSHLSCNIDETDAQKAYRSQAASERPPMCRISKQRSERTLKLRFIIMSSMFSPKPYCGS
jgi:hypothetical protein